MITTGHSTADLSGGEEAMEYGASLITHLFNAMLPVSLYSTYSYQCVKFIFSFTIEIQVWLVY